MSEEMPERLRHLDAREGLVTVGKLPVAEAHRAVAESLPTMHHAPRAIRFGTFRVTGGQGGDLPWPAAVPDKTPAALVPLPAPPGPVPDAFAAAGFSRRVALVDDLGRVSHALRADRADGGFLLAGEHALDLIDDPAGLDAALDEADARERAWLSGAEGLPLPWDDPTYRWTRQTYTSFDSGRRARVPWRSCGGSWGGEPDGPDGLDGARVAHAVERLKRIR